VRRRRAAHDRRGRGPRWRRWRRVAHGRQPAMGGGHAGTLTLTAAAQRRRGRQGGRRPRQSHPPRRRLGVRYRQRRRVPGRPLFLILIDARRVAAGVAAHEEGHGHAVVLGARRRRRALPSRHHGDPSHGRRNGGHAAVSGHRGREDCCASAPTAALPPALLPRQTTSPHSSGFVQPRRGHAQPVRAAPSSLQAPNRQRRGSCAARWLEARSARAGAAV